MNLDTQDTAGNSGVVHVIGIGIAAIVSFAGGLVIYASLAPREFDFIFFEDLSISRAAGSWSNTVRYISSAVFGILSGISYHACARSLNLPFVARLPLSILCGAIGLVFVVIVLGMALAILATIVAVYALFFGPGDR